MNPIRQPDRSRAGSWHRCSRLSLGALLLLLLGWGSAALPPAGADQTYTAQVPFSTSGSMWNNGANGMTNTYPLATYWNFDVSPGFSTDVTALGHFSLGADAASSGGAGLNLSQYANGGSVYVTYPLTLTLTYPDQADLSPGQTFTLHSSWAPGVPGATPYMATKSPKVGLAADAFMDVSQASLHVSARAFGEWLLNDSIFDTSFNYDLPLFDTQVLGNGSTTLFNGTLNVKVKQPVLNSSGSPSGGGTTIQSSATSQFLQFGGNFTNILAAEFPDFLPKFDHTYHWTVEGYGATLGYQLLSLVGTLPVSVGQGFQFTPQPQVQLTLSTGQTASFNAGDSVQLTMPSDGSPLRITPVLTLNNQFSNRMQFQIGGGVSGFIPSGLTLYPFSVSGKVSWGTGSRSLDFSVPSQDLVSFGSVQNVTAYNETFPLGGFMPRTLADLVLTPTVPPPPPPPTLTPNDDYYTGFSTGIGGVPVYRVLAGNGSAVPGVLANDSGSVSFTAVPQEWHDAANPTTHYFILDSQGNLDFAVPQSDYPQGQQFVFPYQITDGQGHTASANIYITVGPNGGG